MKNDSVYSKIIKDFRLKTNKSQTEISKILGVTQATVSRIEKGIVIPSEALAVSIRNLLGLETNEVIIERKENRELVFSKLLNNTFLKPFDVSSISFSYSRSSGDFVVTKKLGPKGLVVLGDCAGHGEDVSKMTFALKFGIECFLQTINEKVIDCSVLQSVLKEGITETHEHWLYPPALITAVLNCDVGSIHLSNSMQPRPKVFEQGNKVEFLDSEIIGETVVVKMLPGNSLLFFTDGFSELFYGEDELKLKFLKYAKAFKGDSKAILSHLLNSVRGVNKKGSLNSETLNDDATAVIISRGRD